MTDIRSVLQRAQRHAADFVDGLPARPVTPVAGMSALRAQLGDPLADAPMEAGSVVDALVAATEGGHMGSAGGRFFGWVIGGPLPSALAADWLVSTWDNNATIAASGPAAAACEEIAGAWVKDLLGLPTNASFAFTTGCQMAHVTGLAAARHGLLRDVGWNVERRGLCGAPPIRVLATEHRHGTLDRALRFLGLGTDCLVPLATDAGAQVTPQALQAALAVADGPTIVALNAGDLHVGAFDRFAQLIPIARAAGAWVHVDGAFGLWARASARHRDKLEGVELAQSWATDAHKWLNTPKDIGLAVVADVEAHRAAMAASASYIAPSAEARDALDWTPEWTRRARAFPVWAALRELGREGLADLIDRCCTHAAALADGFGRLPGGEVVAPASLNQALVRFRSCAPGAGDAEHDARTEAVMAALNAEGTAFFSGGVWRGRRVIRISVVNWRTTTEDVAMTLEAAARVMAQMPA